MPTRAIVSPRAGLAFDRVGSVRVIDRDGHMTISATPIGKAQVAAYQGKEITGWQTLGLDPNRIYNLLRSPEELQRAAQSFRMKQVMFGHVQTGATLDTSEHDAGHLGSNVWFEDPYLMSDMMLTDQEAIDAVVSGKQRELSCSYWYKVKMGAGVFRGARYDGIMFDITGNHVALVPLGRAGRDVLVADSAFGWRKAMKIRFKSDGAAALFNTTMLTKLNGSKAMPAGVQLAMDAEMGEVSQDLIALLPDVIELESEAGDPTGTAPTVATDANWPEMAEKLKAEGVSDETIATLAAMIAPKTADDGAVSKVAMDAAIGAAVTKAVTAARAEEKRAATDLIQARTDVTPLVGKVDLAMDSAEKVYRHALKVKGQPGADTMHVSALRDMVVFMAGKAPAPKLANDAALATGAGSASATRKFNVTTVR